MTDEEKLEAIRAEIHRLVDVRGYDREMANDLFAFMDSLPNEPISNIWHDASEKSNESEDVVIINPSDNTGEVLTRCIGVNQGHIWAYTSELLKLDNPCNIGKNLQESQVKESAEIQHDKETCKENGNSLTQEPVSEVWHDAQTEQPQAKEKILATNEYGDCEVDFAINMALYWKKVIKWAYIEDLLNLSNVQRIGKNWKEPVSEELEEAVNAYIGYTPEVDECSSVYGKRQAFKAGAQWQKEQDQETIELAEDHAMLAGMEKMKEQMMAKAIDAELYSDGMLTPIIKVNDKEKISDIKFGDKVKIIIIKED